MKIKSRRSSAYSLVGAFLFTSLAAAPLTWASGPDGDDHDPQILDGSGDPIVLERPNPGAGLAAHDAATANIVSGGPTAKVTKNLDLTGRGDRFGLNQTTDVWALNGFAYTGTFDSPCGGDPSGEAGIWVWDVHNNNNPSFVGVIESEVGDRTNDVRVASMNSGDILVMSNESCGGGDGGFEIYDVGDPTNPLKLASVIINESDLNTISPLFFAPGALNEVGVHNLFLFTQGTSDYVAAVSEGAFDNFRIYDITIPSSPILVSGWGAEELVAGLPIGVDDYSDLILGDTDPTGSITGNALNDLFNGFGASQNKFLHDATISADGTRAYLANWDAGLVLLDISDVTDPQLISVALDPVNGSLDGEVNSHSVWPNEDGTIVVEGEEDFSAWEASVPPSNLTLDGTATPGNPTIPATAVATTTGDDFEANQTGEIGTTDGTSVIVTSGNLAGNTYPAIELTTALGSPTFGTTGAVTGNLVWIGRACTVTQGDLLDNPVAAGDIAIVRRGACEFEEKANAAAAAGAAAVVIANNSPASTPWSGLRIWDYSDPANPILASTFDTECSASIAPGGNCDPAGTYSVHNVVVETSGNKVKAYISWYSDGMLVLDVTDPYNPVEVARFLDDSTNGGNPNDFWGVYKETSSPWIYGSDRNGGLYVFKEKGAGSAKNGANKKP